MLEASNIGSSLRLCSHSTMPAHFVYVEKKETVAKVEVAFTRYLQNFKTVGNSMVKDSLQDFNAKEMYLRPKNQLVSFIKDRKMFCLHHF